MSLNDHLKNIISQFEPMAARFKFDTIVITSDLIHAIPFIGDSKEQTLLMHMNFIYEYFRCPIWMPSFTFSTSKTHRYNCMHTPSEIGVLNEYFRKGHAQWRSLHPIYSFAGTGPEPNITFEKTIMPYDSTSMFHKMNKEGFYLLSYGTRYGTQSRYLINYIEALANVPYRLNVEFNVEVCDKQGRHELHKACYRDLPHHVKSFRDNRYRLDLYEKLVLKGIIHPLNNKYVFIDLISIPLLIDYLLNKLDKDKYYLLTPEFRQYLQKNMQK